MKLQGVFMIIPLLAVAVSGSTIPTEQLEKADKKWNQDQDGSQNRMGSYEKEKIVESSNLGKKYPTPQHSADNDDGKEPARPSNIVEIDPSFNNQRKIGNNWLDSSDGPSSYWDQYDTDQHSVDDTMSGPMDKSNQGEMTFRDAFKKNHPGNQAQSSVRSKYISQEKTVDVNDILNALKMSHDHSHGTSTGPEQIDNGRQKMEKK
ncbi:hypothetical protein BASA60_004758 [Batrachochytrium salamandrivorans]|nr:hypothetical protein BASA60_004758 [Batrachochytrium salamandrivorans]